MIIIGTNNSLIIYSKICTRVRLGTVYLAETENFLLKIL